MCFRAVTRPVLILLPVLGLTWLCGVLVHLSVVVAYIFITLNAFQVNTHAHTHTRSDSLCFQTESFCKSCFFLAALGSW